MVAERERGLYAETLAAAPQPSAGPRAHPGYLVTGQPTRDHRPAPRARRSGAALTSYGNAPGGRGAGPHGGPPVTCGSPPSGQARPSGSAGLPGPTSCPGPAGCGQPDRPGCRTGSGTGRCPAAQARHRGPAAGLAAGPGARPAAGPGTGPAECRPYDGPGAAGHRSTSSGPPCLPPDSSGGGGIQGGCRMTTKIVAASSRVSAAINPSQASSASPPVNVPTWPAPRHRKLTARSGWASHLSPWTPPLRPPLLDAVRKPMVHNSGGSTATT